MITITPQMKVRLYCQPIDFRKGIDGLVGLTRQCFNEDPFLGSVFLFRNRKANSVKILVYDGQGFWLCQKRLSKGRFRHWPKSQVEALRLTPPDIGVLLFNGDPQKSGMTPAWRKVN